MTSNQTLTGMAGSPLSSDDHPAFLDGSKTSGEIAVSAILRSEVIFNTWVVDADAPGSARRVTSNATWQDRIPSWSPDDSTLLLWMNGNGLKCRALGKVSSAGGTVVRMQVDGKAVDGCQAAWCR